MPPVTLYAAEWMRESVAVAAGGRPRRRGLIPRAAGRALLVRGSAVHGIGMAEPLGVAGIDARGTVLATRRLDPGSIIVLPGAAWVLEVPAGEPLPAVGSKLRITASL